MATSSGWTDAQFGSAPNGWYIGDFNGDRKDDIFRYCPPDKPCGNVVSGAQVFWSTGSKFEDAHSWTDEQFGSAPNGWYVGDFDGDRKDDIMRYCPSDHPCGNIVSGAQVFRSTGVKFEDAGISIGQVQLICFYPGIVLILSRGRLIYHLKNHQMNLHS